MTQADRPLSKSRQLTGSPVLSHFCCCPSYFGARQSNSRSSRAFARSGRRSDSLCRHTSPSRGRPPERRRKRRPLSNHASSMHPLWQKQDCQDAVSLLCCCRDTNGSQGMSLFETAVPCPSQAGAGAPPSGQVGRIPASAGLVQQKPRGRLRPPPSPEQTTRRPGETCRHRLWSEDDGEEEERDAALHQECAGDVALHLRRGAAGTYSVPKVAVAPKTTGSCNESKPATCGPHAIKATCASGRTASPVPGIEEAELIGKESPWKTVRGRQNVTRTRRGGNPGT